MNIVTDRERELMHLAYEQGQADLARQLEAATQGAATVDKAWLHTRLGRCYTPGLPAEKRGTMYLHVIAGSPLSQEEEEQTLTVLRNIGTYRRR